MSIAAVNLTYVGNGPSGAGQILNDGTPGSRSRSLVGYGQATLDGSLSAFTVNFIDGVATFGKSILLSLQSVDVTDGTYTKYHSTGGCGQVKVGDTVTIKGCPTSANNVSSAAVHAIDSSSVTVANASGVAELCPQATLLDVTNATPVALLVSRSGGATDTAAAGTTITPSAITSTGFTANISAAGSNAQLLSFCVEIFFA